MSVTFSIFLCERRIIKKTQKYPLKLRVTANRVPKEFETIHQLTQEEYAKLGAPNISDSLKEVRGDIKKIERLMAVAIKNVSPFDFWIFRRDYIKGNPLFKQKKVKLPPSAEEQTGAFDFAPYYKKFPILTEDSGAYGTIKSVYCYYIKKLISEKRIGNALSYLDSYSAIRKFGGDNLTFPMITISWLRRFEAFLTDKGNARATIGIKLRPLRCIFNEAHGQGIINKEMCYPFGRRKYLIPVGKRRKKSLALHDIQRIYFDKPTTDAEAYAKALWFFMYYANGMNPTDLAHLKYKSIDGDYFSFYRIKTDLTSRHDPVLITVYINEDMRSTIEMYGNADRDPNNYIFPVLRHDMDPLEEYQAVPRLTYFINSWMKKIGKRLEIALTLTTIVTRHSYSTVMKRAGASTEFIQEALGHMDKKTTENYLGSFEKEVKKDFAKKLTAFKDEDDIFSTESA